MWTSARHVQLACSYMQQRLEATGTSLTEVHLRGAGCGGGGCGGWATGAADVPYCMSHTGNHIRNLGLRNLAAMIATQPHLKVVDLGGACGVGVRTRVSVGGARRLSGVKCQASGVRRRVSLVAR